MHILVVEDKQRLARLLHRVLTDERHNVDVAYDGIDGLDLASSGTYDLVLLDLMLPKLDGVEVCQQMRVHDVMTPVLMLTARSEIEDRVLGLNAGADDYLIKPFAMEELVARVNHLPRRAGRATGAKLSVIVRAFRELFTYAHKWKREMQNVPMEQHRTQKVVER